MKRVLIINPNTSQSISELLQLHSQHVAGPEVSVNVCTARFGAPYIACEASYTVAGHAVLDAWACAVVPQKARFHSVLIGCFGDPGLLALREVSQVPVTGLAEASFTEAARTGRFAIVTGGAKWVPILERLAHALGFSPLLAGIHTVAPSGAQLAADPIAAQTLLAQACNAAARRFGVEVIILGGAGLAGMAELIQPWVSARLIDSVVSATTRAVDCAATDAAQPRKTFDFTWKNLSPEMQDLS